MRCYVKSHLSDIFFFSEVAQKYWAKSTSLRDFKNG